VKVKIFLFGSPYIEADGRAIEFSRRKALALVAYLAVMGYRCSRDALAALLWPEYDRKRARAGLRRVLAAINDTPLVAWMTIDRETVTLRKDSALWIDVDQFTTLVRGAGTPEALAEAVDLCHADFMAGFTLSDTAEFDNWQALQAQLFQRTLVNALEQLTGHYFDAQELEAALQRGAALDPETVTGDLLGVNTP
jgi:DNA-binding SARP family transcriptional activator